MSGKKAIVAFSLCIGIMFALSLALLVDLGRCPEMPEQIGELPPPLSEKSELLYEPYAFWLSSSQLASLICTQLSQDNRGPIAGLQVRAHRGSLEIDLCIKGILLLPVRVHLLLVADANSPTTEFALPWECERLRIGRLHLPVSLESACDEQLQALWHYSSDRWGLESITLEEDSILLRGRRR